MSSMGFWRRALADPDWIAVVEPDGTEREIPVVVLDPVG